MSHCIEKLPHEPCGSSDALQVFEEDGKYTGFCFSCGTYVPDPYQGGERKPQPRLAKSQEEIDEEIRDIQSFPILAISDRGISRETCEHFGIRVAVSEVDGSTPIAAYFPRYRDGNIVGYKARLLSRKQFWSIGDVRGSDFFGWHQAQAVGGKKLFITEGEFDAAALYQSLVDYAKGGKWEAYLPAVVSLTDGSGSAVKNITHHTQDMRSYDEIILVFDQDDPGQKAVQDVVQIYPPAKAAKLPLKDANQCLLEGRKRALAEAVLFKSQAPINTKVVNAKDIFLKAREPAQYGLSWPWERMTELTRGVRFGETTYLGAGVKMGKSEVLNALGKHFIINHGLPIFMAKPEESNNKTVKLVAGKVEGKFFHDPKVEFDFEAYDRATKLIGDKLYLMDIYQNMGWPSLRQDVINAVKGHGCKIVFIDPITNMINGIDSGQANTLLQSIAQDLAAMSKDMEFHTFIFCHLRAPDSGPPHERGGEVQSYQFSGSRAMMRSCNYMIGIEGNKDPSLTDEQRNIRKLVLLEDREFGESGTVPLYWDNKTGLFNELSSG